MPRTSGISSPADRKERAEAEQARASALDEPRFHDALRYSLEDYFFLTALAEGRDPFPDFRTALEAHRLVDAIYRSARSGGAAVGVD